MREHFVSVRPRRWANRSFASIIMLFISRHTHKLSKLQSREALQLYNFNLYFTFVRDVDLPSSSQYQLMAAMRELKTHKDKIRNLDPSFL